MNAAERIAPVAGATASFLVTGPDHLADPVLELLPIAAITVSETHIQTARRARFRADALVELADSIKAVGVLQPVLVRPLSAMRGLAKFELVAGERRWIAADRAGLAHILASVRALTDEQVIEVQLIENLQREGLHEMEEAEGYQELMQIKRINADELGALIGKSRSYVYARLKLLALAEPAREAFTRGELDSSRALIVARIQPAKQQARALALATEKGWKGELAHSVRSLKEQLARKRMTVALTGAPFALDVEYVTTDKKLIARIQPYAGTCQACPQRSGNASDGAESTKGDDPDLCTHVDCYDLRVRLHAERRQAEIRAGGGEIVTGEAAARILPGRDAVVGHVDLDAVCEDDEFPEPEPGGAADEDIDEAASQAWSARADAWQPRTYRQLLAGEALEPVLVEDPKTGALRELLSVKVAKPLLEARQIDLAPWRSAAPRTGANPADRQREQAEYQARQEAQRARAEKEIAVRRQVLAALWPRIKGPLKREDLVAIAIELGEQRWGARDALKRLFGKEPQLGTMKDADLQRLLILLPHIAAAENTSSPAGLFALAKRFKVDPAKIKHEFEAAERAKEKGEAAPAKKTSKSKSAPKHKEKK